MNAATWMTGLVLIPFGVSTFLLALSGAEPSHRIQTFSRSSPKEREFDRRATRLRVIGFLSAGFGVVIVLIVVLKLLG